jgi:hypothetical protein
MPDVPRIANVTIEKAQVRFFEAFALKKHLQIAGNLGDAEMRLQMYSDAAGHLAFAVRTGQLDPWTRGTAARDSIEFAKGLDEAKKVLVDAKPVGTSPLEDPISSVPAGSGWRHAAREWFRRRMTSMASRAARSSRIILHLLPPYSPKSYLDTFRASQISMHFLKIWG